MGRSRVSLSGVWYEFRSTHHGPVEPGHDGIKTTSDINWQARRSNAIVSAPLAVIATPGDGAEFYAVRSPVTPNAACAAASRATGTRYGEHDT